MGYLLQYLCHNPSLIKRHTHLVLDEVHERSMDSDLLILLIKKLLEDPSFAPEGLKIVIMSATLQSGLFGEYFSPPGRPVPLPIFVGVRRFPVDVLFLEDLTRAFKGFRAHDKVLLLLTPSGCAHPRVHYPHLLRLSCP